MDFDASEKAVLETYSDAAGREDKGWVVVLALGVLVCCTAILLLLFGGMSLSFSLLSFVAGLVVMAKALQRRRRAIAAGIIRKYDEALKRLEAEAKRDD